MGIRKIETQVIQYIVAFVLVDQRTDALASTLVARVADEERIFSCKHGYERQ